MPRAIPEEFKRKYTAKTGVRLCEARLIQEIADDLGVCPSDVVYLAVQRLLLAEKPDSCEVNRVGRLLSVG